VLHDRVGHRSGLFRKLDEWVPIVESMQWFCVLAAQKKSLDLMRSTPVAEPHSRNVLRDAGRTPLGAVAAISPRVSPDEAGRPRCPVASGALAEGCERQERMVLHVFHLAHSAQVSQLMRCRCSLTWTGYVLTEDILHKRKEWAASRVHSVHSSYMPKCKFIRQRLKNNEGLMGHGFIVVWGWSTVAVTSFASPWLRSPTPQRLAVHAPAQLRWVNWLKSDCQREPPMTAGMR